MNRLYLIGAGVLLFHAGSVAGYLYAKSTLEDAYDARLDREIAATKKQMNILHKHEQFSTVEGAAAALLPTEKEALEALSLYQGRTVTNEDGMQYETGGFIATEYEHADVTDEPVNYNQLGYGTVHEVVQTAEGRALIQVEASNIFDSSDADEIARAWEAELASRSPDRPYLISFEEFNENEGNHALVDLTWYLEDSTLADDREDLIDDVEAIVGRNNLERFGEWSRGQHEVYIRNERVGVQYCITRVESSYGQVVGF